MKALVILLILGLIVAGIIYSVATNIKGSVNLDWLSWKIDKPAVSSKENGSAKVSVSGGSGASSSKGGATSTVEAKKPDPVPPEGFKLADLSTVYKKVSVSGFTKPSYKKSRAGSFKISASLNTGEAPINVTGWRLVGNKGGSVYIPKAINNFLPSSYGVNSEIALYSGNYVSVYSGKSAIGKNFRMNKCIGYINNIYAFTPKLPSNCPSFRSSETLLFSGACQTFINSLSGCEEPTPDEKNKFFSSADASCRKFLDELNYGGCYAKHRLDKDFLSNEWKVWIDDEMPFDTEHDRLVLYDANGKVVNVYVY